MLALVTCHIFPPSIWYGKKWIPGTWLPGWQLAVFQSPRLHECGPADAHGNAQPFCMDKCIFRKKRLFCNLATRWNKILQFVPSFPIYGWLTWWCDFFPVGSAFEDHPQEFGQKKVQPLGLYFWHLRLGLFKSPFFGWWSWRYVVVPFCKDKCIFSKKHMCCNLRARWHKILEFVPSCPICGWLAWWCDFFPVGPTFEDHPQVFSQKRSSPLNFIFDTCASASWSHLFWLVKLNICGCTPFARTNVFSEKKNACFAIWARWHKILEFVPSCPICGWLAWRWDFFPVGSAFEDYPASIQSKKGPAPWILFLTPAPRPLQVTFLVGEAEHVCLYPFARTTVFSAKKTCVLQIGRALTQNSWIRPIMSYLWMIGLVMRLFSCGANLWRSSASIQSKKVQPLGFYFWPLRLGLLKSLFLVGEGEHMCLYPFAKSCKESYPLK